MNGKKNLFGSPSRSAFLYWHKKLDKRLYASDADLVLITKTTPSTGGITAVYDHKIIGRGQLEFTEAVLYKFFIDNGVRVFLVETGYANGVILHPFQVREILAVTDWGEPTFEIDEPIVFANRQAFQDWEFNLRKTSTVEVPK